MKHLAERGNHKRNLILKARQFGFTTLYCIDELDEALWVAGRSCAILAHEREALDKIFEIVKRAFINLPEEIKPITKYDTKRALQFLARFDGEPLDSSIYVAMKLRSGTVQRLHITESSKIKDREELDAGSKQAVPMSGWISEETTGNGFEAFYDLYTDNVGNPNPKPLDYKTYFYPWIDNPEYVLPGELTEKTAEELKIIEIAKQIYGVDITDGQLMWRRWKMTELKKSQEGVGLTADQLFKQEYPLTVQEAFQSGAGSVFDQSKVGELVAVDPLDTNRLLLEIQQSKTPPEVVERFKLLAHKEVWFWEMPDPAKKYIIGVDPSDGEGADYGVIDVWDRDSLAQVAQFYGKTRPDELAEIIAELGKFYNNAFVGVENNMLSTILFLSKIYDNYYFTTKIDEKTLKRTKKIGWSTNTKTRDVMIDDFIIAFDESVLTIRSKITIKEMKTFVKKESGKREHADGKHDDALFAGFIALQMRKFDKPRVRVFEKNPLS